MICFENDTFRIQVRRDGSDLSFYDKIHGQIWIHDPMSMGYRPNGQDVFITMKAIKAELLESTLVLRYLADGVEIVYSFLLCGDYIEVILFADGLEQAASYPLPGSFLPAGNRREYLLPIMQGMVWDAKGEPFDTIFKEAAHVGFSMAMFGCIGMYGGLLVAAETADDCIWRVGKDQTGRSFASNYQIPSLNTIRYDRSVRLYPTDPTITSVAKRYRTRVIERGRFVSWEEKIRKRPDLERLFGSLMCFIGYCQDDIDYVEECKKLKTYGFDRVLLYPARFNTYSKDFLMGGFPPIDLNPEIVADIKALGYDVAPWTWINEGLDDHSDSMAERFRINENGGKTLGWQIDENKWYTCCTGNMPSFQQHAIENEQNDMTWDHFDVITCAVNNECYALDHKTHLGRPLSRSADRAFIRELLLCGQAGTRPVSSENFNDAYSMEYDLGSVKALPQYGPWQFWPIPLTMLVYHDSILHTWWEPHNYNSRYFNRDCGHYQYGGGKARAMAAMDALYGCVPDVFAFGAMYGWNGNGSETFLYKMRFEDPETQFALSQAIPIAQLHRQIGKLEMIDFEFLSEDGYFQKTVFADGTTVYANFAANVSRHIDGVGSLQPESWLALKA